MIKNILIIALITFSICAKGQTPWSNGNLKVSDNNRYLQHENGKPFFWLGDTSWLMLSRLNRDEVKNYLENRREKGFNVVQCIFIQNYEHKNSYGDYPYANNDISQPIETTGSNPDNSEEYDYFDHVDYIVDVAAKNGIYLAIVPTWRDLVKKDTTLTVEKAALFASHLANHFKNKPNIIWINGGSSRGNRYTEIWNSIGETIKKTDPNHLITFPPCLSYGYYQMHER